MIWKKNLGAVGDAAGTLTLAEAAILVLLLQQSKQSSNFVSVYLCLIRKLGLSYSSDMVLSVFSRTIVVVTWGRPAQVN